MKQAYKNTRDLQFDREIYTKLIQQFVELYLQSTYEGDKDVFSEIIAIYMGKI